MGVDEFLQKVQQGQRDFRNIVLRKVSLVGEQLTLLNLDGADLEGSDLTNVNLAGSSLAHAQLGRAILVGANMLSVQCFKANFKGADLSNALLSGAEFQGSDLKQANLSESSCVGIDFSGASLRFADLSNANLKAAKLKGTDLYGAQIKGLDLEGADLEDIIWPDGSEDMTIDRVNDDEIQSLAAVPPLQTPAAIDSEGSSIPQQSMLFGDFEMENSESLANWSSLLFPRAISQPLPEDTIESPQQANLRIANKIASRLERQVQYSFKKYIKKVYGDRCAFSNSGIAALLEAVVIFPEAETNQDHPSNGLLLRVDLARLFDLNLMTIDPENYQILIAPSLRQSEYASFSGMKLRVPAEPRYHPSPVCLKWHFEQCEWIKNPNLVQRESLPIVEMPPADLIPIPEPRSSRFFQASKSWIKRINQVLNSPIHSPIAPEKPGKEFGKESSLSENTATIVSFAPQEISSETHLDDGVVINKPAVEKVEAIENPVIKDSVNLDPVNLDPINLEPITPAETIVKDADLSPDQSLESSLSDFQDVGSNQGWESNLELEELAFPPPPPLYRVETSVTQNLDRLQQSLDTIVQELEPYLQTVDHPLGDVTEMLESLEKELEASIGKTNSEENLDLTHPREILDLDGIELTSEGAIVAFEDLFNDAPLIATEIATDSEENNLFDDMVQAEPIIDVALPDLSLDSESNLQMESNPEPDRLETDIFDRWKSFTVSDGTAEFEVEIAKAEILEPEFAIAEIDSEPIVPDVAEPINPDILEPIALGVMEPIVPDVAEPINPDILEPIALGVMEPIVPDVAEPINPDISEPIAFGVMEPIVPDVAEPINPDISEPIAFGVMEPIVPDVAEPINSDIAEPIVPSVVEPINPDASATPESAEQEEEKIQEEKITSFRKGLAALLFRRFYQ